jgi:hypothetical protein
MERDGARKENQNTIVTEKKRGKMGERGREREREGERGREAVINLKDEPECIWG